MAFLKTLLIVFLLTFATPVVGQTENSNKPDSSLLTTSGTAEIEVPADEAKINLSVVTENKDSAEALKTNNDILAKVIKALQSVGLEKNEFQTGNFQVLPRYADNMFGNANQISSYTVTNSINIKTVRIELLGKIISEANKAGANQINSINFGLANSRIKRDFVIKKATTFAIEDAKFLAEAANVELIKILSITLDNAAQNVMFPQTAFRGQENFSRMKDVSLPPIEPGSTTIRSTVTVTYEVRSKL